MKTILSGHQLLKTRFHTELFLNWMQKIMEFSLYLLHYFHIALLLFLLGIIKINKDIIAHIMIRKIRLIKKHIHTLILPK